MDLGIEHDRDGARFVACVEGHRAEVDYRLEGATMVITHTGVPEPIEGRGIAAALIRAALLAARESGWKVRARCAYAADYLRQHREFDDLRE
jgi:predicted GNAT family acetyltransferase